jgi:Holliday junction resolvasome RuvABC DNA-binding subunit
MPSADVSATTPGPSLAENALGAAFAVLAGAALWVLGYTAYKAQKAAAAAEAEAEAARQAKAVPGEQL